MNPDPKESWARERIEAYVQTGRLIPKPLAIHPDLAAHMSEADQRLCSESLAAIECYISIATRDLKGGRASGMSPLRWAAETLLLLADLVERAQAECNAKREASWDAWWEAKWKAEAPLRAANEAQARWITDWSQTTPEGQAWKTRIDAAPTLMAYHHLMWEAEAVYAAWQQAHPDAARLLVEEAAVHLDEINQPEPRNSPAAEGC
jgi:hypothetical protein